MDSNILGWYNILSKNGFKKTEFHESNKRDEEDVTNLENLPNHILNHLQSFKFYSDEEFDAFNV